MTIITKTLTATSTLTLTNKEQIKMFRQSAAIQKMTKASADCFCSYNNTYFDVVGISSFSSAELLILQNTGITDEEVLDKMYSIFSKLATGYKPTYLRSVKSGLLKAIEYQRGLLNNSLKTSSSSN